MAFPLAVNVIKKQANLPKTDKENALTRVEHLCTDTIAFYKSGTKFLTLEDETLRI